MQARRSCRRTISCELAAPKEVKVTLQAPFGLALRTLPASKSGRGVYVEEVVEGGSAFEDGTVLAGDVLTRFGAHDRKISMTGVRL